MDEKIYADWQLRVINEKVELDKKIYNLNVFLEGDWFESLDECDQDLLIKQANIMDDYSHILDLRIQKF